MPERSRRLRSLVRSVFARPRRALLPTVVALSAATAIGAGPVGAATADGRDLYFGAGYERQVDNRTCTAAATAMMMNFIAGRDMNLAQMPILRYEQTRDALNNAVQRGSDPLGWSRAATYFSGYTRRQTTYLWETYDSELAALRRAARLIAYTGKPVGLLVKHGSHAVVMTGYTASRSPLRDHFELLTVAISDPYGSHHYWVAAPSAPLDRYYQLDATTTYDRLWYGKFIIIAPQG
ncbi:MAG TPA: C39 family peptidase [Candidatus Limnocylindrales bacterium]|nr:C39 family peptidase [Candidatus Limnocylindrales bacterium]